MSSFKKKRKNFQIGKNLQSIREERERVIHLLHTLYQGKDSEKKKKKKKKKRTTTRFTSRKKKQQPQQP